MGYRDDWFNNNKPDWGNKYRCCKCGGLFPKSQIDIDHIIPLRKGGTNDLWNLQPMCKTCNRSKGANQSTGETLNTMARAAIHGQLGNVIGGMAMQGVKDTLGIKYKRR